MFRVGNLVSRPLEPIFFDEYSPRYTGYFGLFFMEVLKKNDFKYEISKR